MRRSVILATVFATVLVLVLPFVGGAGPSPLAPAANANAEGFSLAAAVGQPIGLVPAVSDSVVAVAALKLPATVVEPVVSKTGPVVDSEHLAQKP